MDHSEVGREWNANAEDPRPRYHFTPERNWMNDPNGLVYHDGEYHLFYQHNPYGTSHGHMSWGHAVSADLIHWTHLPIAIMEESENSITIFSGSAVVDEHNTSGFGTSDAPAMVAVYTADHRPDKLLQDIHIAYSIDRGRTFTKYDGNPVLDVNHRKFGDPKVFWHEPTEQWIMVNILGWEQGRVVLYGSSNLTQWEFLSEFTAPGAAPGIWECPDLFPLCVDGNRDEVKWVLKINATGEARSRYFVGEFDGRVFRVDDSSRSGSRLDYGNFYAEVTYNNSRSGDGRRILMGWIPQQPSPRRSWTGVQSIPRELTLRARQGGLRLCQTPVAELQSLRREGISLHDHPVTDGARAWAVTAKGMGEVELLAVFEPRNGTEVGFRLDFGNAGETVVAYSVHSRTFFLQCPGQDRIVAPVQPCGSTVRLHVLIDRSVLEIYADDGEATITALIERQGRCRAVRLHALGGESRLIAFDAWPLAGTPLARPR